VGKGKSSFSREVRLGNPARETSPPFQEGGKEEGAPSQETSLLLKSIVTTADKTLGRESEKEKGTSKRGVLFATCRLKK